MSHTYFSHFNVSNPDGAITVRPLNTREAMDALMEELKEWAKDQYTNSWYWIAPNVHLALCQMQTLVDMGEMPNGRSVIVPIMNYDGLTGEEEWIKCEAVFVTEI